MRKAFLAASLALALPGCAQWQNAAVAIHAAGKADVQNVNDDALGLEIEGMCAQPYSALVRNSSSTRGLPTAILALCGPIPAPGQAAVFGGTVLASPGSATPTVLAPAGTP